MDMFMVGFEVTFAVLDGLAVFGHHALDLDCDPRGRRRDFDDR